MQQNLIDSQIKIQIENVLRGVCNNPQLVISDEMKIFADLKLDSLDFAEFVQNTEQTIGLKIDMSLYLKLSEKKDFRTMKVSDFVSFVLLLKTKS